MSSLNRRGHALAALLLGMALLVGGPVPSAAQTARHAMSIDDFLALKVVGDPRISPLGDLVAFTVTTPSLEANRNVTKLWLYDLTAGTARELTGGAGSDYAPAWAADGRTLHFISSRGGSPQIWKIRTDGGEPIRVTSVETGVSQFFLSADTTALFVVSDVKWPAQQELDRRQGQYPTDAKLWTGLFYRHWTEWRIGLRQHLLRVALPNGPVTDVTPFDRDVPTLALGGSDVALSPLGSELAVVFNPDSVVATSTNNDIFLVGPDGTGLVAMTDAKGNDHSPVYSPNARWLAYLSMATPGFEADRQQIVLYDRASGERTPLAADWDRSVQAMAWMPDSRSLVVEVEEQGAHNVYQLGVPDGQRTLLVKGGLNSGLQISPSGDRLVFVRQTGIEPPELFSLDLTGKQPVIRQLTALNTGTVSRLDLKPLEPFRFVGAAEDTVSGWLMKPPGFDPGKRYPLVYLIHGGPQGSWLDSWHQRWNYALFASRGYVVAAVNFHGSTGYGQAFTNSISEHWGDVPYEDLMKGLDWLAAQPFVDSTRMGAAGASYGGYMIYWMAGHTDRFRTLIAHDGVFNTESMAGSTEELWFPIHEFGGPVTSPAGRSLLEKWSPARHTDRWKTPMLIVHSQLDYRVDLSEGYQAWTALKLQGLPGKFLYFPDEGHFVLKPRNRRLWWGVVLDWLDQYLKPGQP